MEHADTLKALEIYFSLLLIAGIIFWIILRRKK
jgi:hypothetical protein